MTQTELTIIDYMNTKLLIENIIEDLVNDASISKIMLKAQAIAYALDNDDFQQWVYKEQNGYNSAKEVPEYRKVDSGLVVSASLSFGRIANNYPLPIDIIADKSVRDYLKVVKLMQPIAIIENFLNDSDTSSMYFEVPGFLWKDIETCLNGGNVLSAKQIVPVASFRSVVEKLKSQLLHFFLELSKQIDIDFNVLTSKEKITGIMNQTFYAGIVNTGSGDVHANNATIVGGTNNNVSLTPLLKEQIETILQQIETIKSDISADEHDIAEVIMDIRNELEKLSPCKRFVKNSLQALKSFGRIIAEKSIECGLNNILSQL